MTNQTTKIEWKDAEKSRPDKGEKILFAYNGEIQRGQYEKSAGGDFRLFPPPGGSAIVQYDSIDFWAPYPEAPEKDPVKDELEKVIKDWDQIEERVRYSWRRGEVWIKLKYQPEAQKPGIRIEVDVNGWSTKDNVNGVGDREKLFKQGARKAVRMVRDLPYEMKQVIETIEENE